MWHRECDRNWQQNQYKAVQEEWNFVLLKACLGPRMAMQASHPDPIPCPNPGVV